MISSVKRRVSAGVGVFGSTAVSSKLRQQIRRVKAALGFGHSSHVLRNSARVRSLHAVCYLISNFYAGYTVDFTNGFVFWYQNLKTAYR